MVEFLLHVIPDTVGAAFTNGDILQVLLVSILFGFGLALGGERTRSLQRGIESLGVVVFRVVHLIMRAAPLGHWAPWLTPSASSASVRSRIWAA